MIKSKKSVAECVKQVEQMKVNGQFENYIEYMQFPFYKNFLNCKCKLDKTLTHNNS